MKYIKLLLVDNLFSFLIIANTAWSCFLFFVVTGLIQSIGVIIYLITINALCFVTGMLMEGHMHLKYIGAWMAEKLDE